MADKCILNPEQDCLGLIRAQELEKDIVMLRKEMTDAKSRNELAHKEFYNRLAVIDAHNKVQDAHYEHIIEKLTDITEKLSNVSTRISTLEFKPAKKWETVAEKVLMLVLGAVAAVVFAKIGLQ